LTFFLVKLTFLVKFDDTHGAVGYARVALALCAGLPTPHERPTAGLSAEVFYSYRQKKSLRILLHRNSAAQMKHG
jgi:hypothetical protein